MKFNVRNIDLHKLNRNYLLQLLASPVLISLIFSILIIYILPPLFNKYTVNIVSMVSKSPNDIYYYADFDNDGLSEKIIFSQSRKDFFSLKVYKTGKLIDQWNFSGKYIWTMSPLISNIDTDSFKVIFFTAYKDSGLYLWCLNPLKKKFITKNKFVVKYKPEYKVIDIGVQPQIFYDSNKDGIKEFYFITDAGYSKKPREIVKYDPANNSVICSPESYASIFNKIIPDTSKGSLRLYSFSDAVGNNPINDPYSDMFAWLMCFDQDLNFEVPPEKLGFYPSNSFMVPLLIKNKTRFALMNIYTGNDKHFCFLSLINTKLKPLKYQKFIYTPDWKGASLAGEYSSDWFYLVKMSGVIKKIDGDLQVKDTYHIPPIAESRIGKYDLDGDGKKEILYNNPNFNKLIIVRNDFSGYSSINIQNLIYLKSCSFKQTGSKDRAFVITTDDNEISLKYHYNRFFYLKYTFYVSIYLVVFLSVFLLEKVQKNRAELKYNSEKKITELQLKAIKNQIDPHFTLNVINSIGALSYKQDREKADYIFGKYSKLLRSTILNSDKIASTLEEELDYVKNYLELEKYRNGNSFNWIVKSDNDVKDNIRIPRMLIHTFVENSIKHGLRYLEKDGELTISVRKKENNYFINIRDNGIGRRKASEIETGNTGRGLNIIDQILDLYYNLVKTRITYSIKDLKDNENNPLGTEVSIVIPVN